MSKTRVVLISLLAVVALVGVSIGGVSLLSTQHSEEEHGHSHDHDGYVDGGGDVGLIGDPVETDLRVATSAHLSALRTWYPEEQENPVDAVVAMKDRLSGKLLQHAELASPEPRPDVWEAWARSGDYVQAFVEVDPNWDEPEGMTRVEVPVEFWQDVIHSDLRSTPWSLWEGVAIMVWEDERWKLAEYEIETSYFYGDLR